VTTPTFHQRALAQFDALVELDPQQRAQRLAQLAGNDPPLHDEVRALLAADGVASGLLERTPASLLAGHAPDDPDDLDDGKDGLIGQRLGPWRILGVLGRGGMGAVYHGERADGQFQQQAAIKLIRVGMDHPDLRRRFLRERQILARLQHPHIATLLDGGVAENGTPYFAMERVDGAPIDRWCDAQRLDLHARVRLLLQVCDAVQHAHQNLTVHRDLKPSNILITASGQAKLLDFGIAKLLQDDDDGGATIDRPFTPEYAAPEQIRGEAITTATDLYALGVVLYGLLAGAHPFGLQPRAPLKQQLEQLDRAPETITHAALRLDPSQAQSRGLNPRALASALRGDLSAIVHRCLEPDPARRYTSAEALANDLKAWLDERPVSARRASRGYAIGKFVSRHRWSVAAGVIALLAIGGALSIALMQARQARLQAQRATHTKDFVVALFREANPLRNAQGAKLSAVDVLNAAAQRVEAELGDAPQTQAELRSAIGFSLYQLGELKTGRPLLERGIAQMRTSKVDGPVLASALHNRAVVARETGDYHGAERDTREALRLLDRADGDHRLLRVNVRTTLGMVATMRGQYQEALALTLENLRDRTALLGETHLDVAGSWNNVANSYLQLDRYADAEAAFNRASAALASQGPEHPRMIWLLLGTGVARIGQAQRIALAEPAFAEAERLLLKTLHAEHPIAVYLHNSRATLYLRQGRLAEAEATFVRSLALAKAAQDHQQLQQIEGHLGVVKLAQGRAADAERHLTPAVAALARERVSGEPFLNRLQSARGLARFQLGHRAEGEREIRAALQRMQAADFAMSDDYADSASDLAELLEISGRTAEAQTWRQRAHASFVRVYGAMHPRTRLAATRVTQAMPATESVARN
jgi:tetratricopeptide (TPR) repeat protein